jgi:hypothetical protein
MKPQTVLPLLLLCVAGIRAENAPAQAFPAGERSPVETRTTLNYTVSSIPEAKIGIAHTWIVPFLRGNSFLTQDNNISATLGAELSPVSANALAEIVWTPAAFFQAVTGGRAGLGWNISLLGADITGTGINKRNADGSSGVDGSAFDGLLWAVKAGGALQADFAAFVPGDWNHIVFRTYHEINYAGYSAASAGEPWYFENDDGENQNGFSYYANALLGYRPPLFLETAALLAEVSTYLYDAPDPALWGGALPRWTFSLLLNFTVTRRVSIAALCQLRTRRTWTDDTRNNAFYQDRRLADPSLHLEFYRVAAVVSIAL